MNQTLEFNETVVDALKNRLQAPIWEEAKKAYNQRNNKETILKVIDYAGAELRTKYGNKDNTHFKIPHGSVIVEIHISDTELEVTVPFLDISSAHQIPLLRRVAEVNFSPLNLAQIKLKEEHLYFTYSTPLDLCDPYKIYYVFREICHTADDLDDEMIDQFKANFLQSPSVIPFEAGALDRAWDLFQKTLDEANAYMDYFDSKRWGNFNWDIVVIALKKLEYTIKPSGKLRTDIERAVTQIYNGQEDFQTRVQRGRSFLTALKSTPRSEFDTYIQLTETFVPIKSLGDIQNIKLQWEKRYKSAGQEIQKKEYLGAALTLLVGYYDMFYYYNLQEDINQKVVGVLNEASQKSWEDTAHVLFKGVTEIMEGNLSVAGHQEKKQSFFTNLFNKKK